MRWDVIYCNQNRHRNRNRNLSRRPGAGAPLAGAGAPDLLRGFFSFVSSLILGLAYALFGVHNWIMKGNK
jgi:hypothetical protein